MTSASTSVFDESMPSNVTTVVVEEETMKKPAAKVEKKPAVSEGFLLKKPNKEKEGKEVVKTEEEGEKLPTKYILGGVFFVTAWAISFLLKRK